MNSWKLTRWKIPSYRANAADRCYFCKDELFSVLDQIAIERKFEAVCYGVNADDTLDFRPGHRAAKEHQVLAPLLDARTDQSRNSKLIRARRLAHLGPARFSVPFLAPSLWNRSNAGAPGTC